MSDFDPNTSTPSLGVTVLASVARGALNAGAGALVSLGAITSDQQTQLVSIGVAVVLWAAAQGWSYIQKRDIHRALKAK